MKITYLAHACFLIETSKRIITDPYEPGSYSGSVGYAPINESADIVTVSHQHWDHNAVSQVKGNPIVIDAPRQENISGIKIKGIESFHDRSKGSERGKNIIFIIETEGIKLAHFGDQGFVTSEGLKGLDIILLPVGGVFTIGPQEAKEIVDMINPRIVIPMHYKTPKLGFDIKGVDDFLKLNKDKEIEIMDGSSLEITPDILPSKCKVVVLRHSR